MALLRGKRAFHGRGHARRNGKSSFHINRVEEQAEDDQRQSPSAILQPLSGEEHGEETDASSVDEELPESNGRSYSTLLQSLQSSSYVERPPRKKRKPENSVRLVNASTVTVTRREIQSPSLDEPDAIGNETDEDNASVDADVDKIEEDDEQNVLDPFESHFCNADEEQISLKVKAIESADLQTHKVSSGVFKAHVSLPYISDIPKMAIPSRITSVRDLKLKKRLSDTMSQSKFDAVQEALATYLFNYQDILFTARSPANAESLRKITCLHALNHVFKTRDRVIKNNARLRHNQLQDDDDQCRDQGFTRPKVLMLLETRHSCMKAVNMITALCQPEQQENKKRFQDEFVQDERRFSEEKPDDFRELFEGNDDNDFRIGLKFTRKTIKYFSQFYNSDILFASPLGLRRIVDSDDPKKRDYDFLSSIEIVIVDQADAMLMQNWGHVEQVFQHLNLRPRETHGCDFSRVRLWYLDDRAKYLRQTIVLSAYNTPELNSLFSHHMNNVAGKVKFSQEYEGAILEIGSRVKQTFSRYDSPSPASDPDFRFKHFTTAIVPSLTKYAKPSDGAYGALIFISSYLDFVRIRNYFASSTVTQNISFGSISEYTDLPDVRRARSHFLTGRHSALLYTGRAHHFRRYHIRGVKRVVMYGLPENPIFYREIVGGFLGTSISEGRVNPAEAGVRTLFSKWDGLYLERIVGTQRVGSMLREKSGDTFDFV